MAAKRKPKGGSDSGSGRPDPPQDTAQARIVPTIGIAARELGVHERTLKNWLNARGCPGRQGHYDIGAIAAWHEENIGGSIGDAESSEKTRWTVEKLKAEAKMRQIELAQLEGRLVSREDVERSAAELVLRLRERFESIPDDLQMEFPAKQRAQWKLRLESRVRLILMELAAWGEKMEPEANAKDEGGRMKDEKRGTHGKQSKREKADGKSAAASAAGSPSRRAAEPNPD